MTQDKQDASDRMDTGSVPAVQSGGDKEGSTPSGRIEPSDWGVPNDGGEIRDETTVPNLCASVVQPIAKEMLPVVTFNRQNHRHPLAYCYYCDESDNMTGRYVPLATAEALQQRVAELERQLSDARSYITSSESAWETDGDARESAER